MDLLWARSSEGSKSNATPNDSLLSGSLKVALDITRSGTSKVDADPPTLSHSWELCPDGFNPNHLSHHIL